MHKLVAALAVLLLAPAALAEDRATTKDAEMLVHKAVAYLKREGREKALAAFSDPRGPFTYRDLYVYVLDTKVVMRAHGRKPELIGKDQMQQKDAQGRFFARDVVELAKTKGSGWTEYLFENPVSGRIEHKVAYVELVDDLVVGCGAFKP